MVKILQHCFGKPHAGGPATALSRMLENSSANYPVIWQKRPAGGFSVSLIYNMVNEIRSHRPDLIHVRGLGNEGFHACLAARIAGVPKILVSIHGTHRDLKLPNNRLKNQIVTQIIEPLTLKMADAIVAVCEFASKRDFLKPYIHKILQPVPNGVLLPEIISDDRKLYRDKLGIPEDRIVAVCVSRLTREKGYEDLAESMKIIERNNRIIDLIIVGGGKEEDIIKEFFSKLKKISVHFVGQQNNVIPYLKMSDMFLFATWNENLSNALLEAMACSLPVVVTDVGGNREVVDKGGGIVVPVREVNEFAQAVEFLIDNQDKALAMGHSAMENIKSNYTIDQMINKWEITYKKVLQID